MSSRSKNINLFLMDGEANGRIKASISNWTGVAYKIPRAKLSAFKDRSDLSQSSVYFLFGPAQQNHRAAVYIGQAGVRKNGGGILTRLMEHDKNPDKDYWSEAVVFTTSNNSFGPTELSYLENAFCGMAKEACRYEVKNANDPTPGNITEEKESELEEFSDFAQLILGVLGYKVFEKVDIVSCEFDGKHRASLLESTCSPHTTTMNIPPLPDPSLKIGQYVRTAMRNLASSGYKFTQQQIDVMCAPEWSLDVFGTQNPFFKKFTGGKIDTKGSDGYTRFWSEIFTFGTISVLVSKEWYPGRRAQFDAWYNTLS